MSETQPLLFEEPQEPTPLDTGEIAKRIAAAARPVQYDDRTSEAAKDQGWGPYNLPSRPEDKITLSDPGLNADWHREQAEKPRIVIPSSIQGIGKTATKLTIKQKNANEQEHIKNARFKRFGY